MVLGRSNVRRCAGSGAETAPWTSNRCCAARRGALVSQMPDPLAASFKDVDLAPTARAFRAGTRDLPSDDTPQPAAPKRSPMLRLEPAFVAQSKQQHAPSCGVDRPPSLRTPACLAGGGADGQSASLPCGQKDRGRLALRGDKCAPEAGPTPGPGLLDWPRWKDDPAGAASGERLGQSATRVWGSGVTASGSGRMDGAAGVSASVDEKPRLPWGRWRARFSVLLGAGQRRSLFSRPDKGRRALRTAPH